MKVKVFKLRGKNFRERIVSLKENIVTKMTMGILRPFNRHRMVQLRFGHPEELPLFCRRLQEFR